MRFFLNFVRHADEWTASHSSHFTCNIYWMKDCICSRGGPDLKTKVTTPVTARTAVCGVVFKITVIFFLLGSGIQ